MSTTATESVSRTGNSPERARAHPGALVMGGDYRGLALVRSLGRQGIPVWVINQTDQRLAGVSRYTQRTLFFPSWHCDGAIDFLLGVGQRYGLEGWLLFPTSDESVRLVASHHQELARQFRLTIPPWETLQWAVDKRLMHQLADSVAVDHAKTYYPRRSEDLTSLDLPFPVILKPASREQFNRLTAAKAWQVNDLKTLLARYDEAIKLLPPEMLMVQEIIPGSGESQFSYAALCDQGRPLASLTARRTRQFPMDFGRASTLVEIVDDPGIVAPSVRLLKAINFTGICEVEFKRDSRTGQFKLLDINPRVWGWFSLCAASGVDFAHLLWLLYHGQPIPEVRACVGTQWVRLSTDIATSIQEILRGRMSVRDYLLSLRRRKEPAVFASDDPRPGLLELPLLLSLFVQRVFRGKGI